MDSGGKKSKARFFGWRDLLLIHRLQGRGQALDYEVARVDGVFPLQDALQNYLLLGTGCRRTLVMTGSDAFAQYVCPKGSNRVHLTYLAPAPTNDRFAQRWIDFLEDLVALLGARGIHHIVAEAGDDGPAIELLQRVGFGVFTRQTLFRLASPPEFAGNPPPLTGLRPWKSTDEWGLRVLYTNSVPQLVQQIEAAADNAFTSSQWQDRLVLERKGEIVASIAGRRGRVGSALRLLIHPEADTCVEALLQHGLARLANGASQPVFCRVRRYEGWLQAALEASGFEPVAHTALLVKHTVARVMTPEWNRIPAVNGRAEITTPMTGASLRKSTKP